MSSNNHRINSKQNRCNAVRLEACDEIHIARVDLKRKNYKNIEVIFGEKEWQCSNRDRVGTTLILLDRMWKEQSAGFREKEVPA